MRTEQIAQIAIDASPKRKRAIRSPYVLTALLLPLILVSWWMATSVTNSVPADPVAHPRVGVAGVPQGPRW